MFVALIFKSKENGTKIVCRIHGRIIQACIYGFEYYPDSGKSSVLSIDTQEWAGFKFLLKEATEVLKEKDKVPSLGVVSQKYADSDFVIEAVDAVQSAAKVDKEIIIDQLEAYIKDVEFQLLSKKYMICTKKERKKMLYG